MIASSLEIRSGPATVLDAGQVTCFGGSDLSFAFEVDGEPVAFELRFVRDPSVEDVAVATHEIDNGYRVTAVNFDKPDGRGSAIPVVLKHVGGDVVLVHFRVFLFGRTPDRTVHYTFYRVANAELVALIERVTGGG